MGPLRQNEAERLGLGRRGDPDDCARLLASDPAGEHRPVDGSHRISAARRPRQTARRPFPEPGPNKCERGGQSSRGDVALAQRFGTYLEARRCGASSCSTTSTPGTWLGADPADASSSGAARRPAPERAPEAPHTDAGAARATPRDRTTSSRSARPLPGRGSSWSSRATGATPTAVATPPASPREPRLRRPRGASPRSLTTFASRRAEVAVGAAELDADPAPWSWSARSSRVGLDEPSGVDPHVVGVLEPASSWPALLDHRHELVAVDVTRRSPTTVRSASRRHRATRRRWPPALRCTRSRIATSVRPRSRSSAIRASRSRCSSEYTASRPCLPGFGNRPSDWYQRMVRAGSPLRSTSSCKR